MNGKHMYRATRRACSGGFRYCKAVTTVLDDGTASVNHYCGEQHIRDCHVIKKLLDEGVTVNIPFTDEDKKKKGWDETSNPDYQKLFYQLFEPRAEKQAAKKQTDREPVAAAAD
ncbi:MAG: hypothetical protein ABIG30_01580 [Candidatus Aenigmatarchaeota archaeon]